MRQLALLLALILVLLLGGCAGTDAEEAEDYEADEPSSRVKEWEPWNGDSWEGESEDDEDGDDEVGHAFIPYAMDESQQAHCDEFVQSLLYSGILMDSWSAEDYADLGPDEDGNGGYSLLYALHDLLREEMENLIVQYEADLPAAEIEGRMTTYFPFSAEELHEILRNSYDADTGTYRYLGERGGGPIEAAVTNVNIGLGAEDGATIRLRYELYFGQPWTDDDWETTHYQYRIRGTLTLHQNPNGSFRYLSVEAGEREEGSSTEV